MTFHVVCHDCTFEELPDDEIEATELATDHASDTGHDVEFAEVSA